MSSAAAANATAPDAKITTRAVRRPLRRWADAAPAPSAAGCGTRGAGAVRDARTGAAGRAPYPAGAVRGAEAARPDVAGGMTAGTDEETGESPGEG